MTTPIDPDDIVVELRPTGFTALTATSGLLEFEYAVRNENVGSIFLVDAPDMPYVTVEDSGSVRLNFLLEDVVEDIQIFVPPDLIELSGGDSLLTTFRIEYPFRPSAHFMVPGAPVPTASTIDVKVIQGFGETRFDFDPMSYSLLDDFLAYQDTVESDVVTLMGM